MQRKHGLPVGDFPHLGRFRDTIKLFEIWNFPSLDNRAYEVGYTYDKL